MAINLEGLPIVPGARTLTSGGPPIALNNEIRGGIHRISGEGTDTLANIDARHLQAGMLVYNENTSQYTMYRNVGDAPASPPDANDPYRGADGRLPNNVGTIGADDSNWIEFRLSPEVLNDVGNVSIVNPQAGQVLEWNGTMWVNSEDNVISALGSIGDVYLTNPAPGQVIEYSTDIPNPNDPNTPLSGWINATDTTLENLEDLMNVSYGTGTDAPGVGQVLEIATVDNTDPANPVVTWRNAADNPLNNSIEQLSDVEADGRPDGSVLQYNATSTNWEDALLALASLSDVSADIANAEVGDGFGFGDDPNDPGNMRWIRRPRATPSTPADQLRVRDQADPGPDDNPNFLLSTFLYELRVDIDRAGNRVVTWMETPGEVDFTIQDRPNVNESETAFRRAPSEYVRIGYGDNVPIPPEQGGGTYPNEQTRTVDPNIDYSVDIFNDVGPIVWGTPLPDSTAATRQTGTQPALWFFATNTDTEDPFIRSATGSTPLEGDVIHISLSYDGVSRNNDFTKRTTVSSGDPRLAALIEAIPAGEYTAQIFRGLSFTSSSLPSVFVGVTELRDQNGVLYRVPQPPQDNLSPNGNVIGVHFGTDNPDAPTPIAANASLFGTTIPAGITPSDPLFVFEHGGTLSEASVAGSHYVDVTRREATTDIPYPRIQVEASGEIGIAATNAAGTAVDNPNTDGGRAVGEVGNNRFPNISAGTGIELRANGRDDLQIVNTFQETDSDTAFARTTQSLQRTAGAVVQEYVRGNSSTNTTDFFVQANTNTFSIDYERILVYTRTPGAGSTEGQLVFNFLVSPRGTASPFSPTDIVLLRINEGVDNSLQVAGLLPGDYTAVVTAVGSVEEPGPTPQLGSYEITLDGIKRQSGGLPLEGPATPLNLTAAQIETLDIELFELSASTGTLDNFDPFVLVQHSPNEAENSAIRFVGGNEISVEQTELGVITFNNTGGIPLFQPNHDYQAGDVFFTNEDTDLIPVVGDHNKVYRVATAFSSGPTLSTIDAIHIVPVGDGAPGRAVYTIPVDMSTGSTNITLRGGDIIEIVNNDRNPAPGITGTYMYSGSFNFGGTDGRVPDFPLTLNNAQIPNAASLNENFINVTQTFRELPDVNFEGNQDHFDPPVFNNRQLSEARYGASASYNDNTNALSADALNLQLRVIVDNDFTAETLLTNFAEGTFFRIDNENLNVPITGRCRAPESITDVDALGNTYVRLHLVTDNSQAIIDEITGFSVQHNGGTVEWNTAGLPEGRYELLGTQGEAADNAFLRALLTGITTRSTEEVNHQFIYYDDTLDAVQVTDSAEFRNQLQTQPTPQLLSVSTSLPTDPPLNTREVRDFQIPTVRGLDQYMANNNQRSLVGVVDGGTTNITTLGFSGWLLKDRSSNEMYSWVPTPEALTANNPRSAGEYIRLAGDTSVGIHTGSGAPTGTPGFSGNQPNNLLISADRTQVWLWTGGTGANEWVELTSSRDGILSTHDRLVLEHIDSEPDGISSIQFHDSFSTSTSARVESMTTIETGAQLSTDNTTMLVDGNPLQGVLNPRANNLQNVPPLAVNDRLIIRFATTPAGQTAITAGDYSVRVTSAATAGDTEVRFANEFTRITDGVLDNNPVQAEEAIAGSVVGVFLQGEVTTAPIDARFDLTTDGGNVFSFTNSGLTLDGQPVGGGIQEGGFLGAATATTPADVDDDSTRVATTEFVHNATDLLPVLAMPARRREVNTDQLTYAISFWRPHLAGAHNTRVRLSDINVSGISPISVTDVTGDVPTMDAAGSFAIALINANYLITFRQEDINGLQGSDLPTTCVVTYNRGLSTLRTVAGVITGDGGGALPASGVTEGTYLNADITVNAQGIITAAVNGASGGGANLPYPSTGGFAADNLGQVTHGASDVISWPSRSSLVQGISGITYTAQTGGAGSAAADDVIGYFTNNTGGVIDLSNGRIDVDITIDSINAAGAMQIVVRRASTNTGPSFASMSMTVSGEGAVEFSDTSLGDNVGAMWGNGETLGFHIAATSTARPFTYTVNDVRVSTSRDQFVRQSIISSFTGLDDTPADYSGSGGQLVSVNSGATALEFTPAPVNFAAPEGGQPGRGGLVSVPGDADRMQFLRGDNTFHPVLTEVPLHAKVNRLFLGTAGTMQTNGRVTGIVANFNYTPYTVYEGPLDNYDATFENTYYFVEGVSIAISGTGDRVFSTANTDGVWTSDDPAQGVLTTANAVNLIG